MKRTVSIPVDLPFERFLPLVAECAEIFNAHVDWALAKGKRTAFVDARHTSQRCSVCKHISRTNRKKSLFHCRNYGHKAHADVNAAVNIRDNYFLSAAASQSVEQAVVNQPNVIALVG
jgi:Putative transposase DNA-binding domain